MLEAVFILVIMFGVSSCVAILVAFVWGVTTLNTDGKQTDATTDTSTESQNKASTLVGNTTTQAKATVSKPGPNTLPINMKLGVLLRRDAYNQIGFTIQEIDPYKWVYAWVGNGACTLNNGNWFFATLPQKNQSVPLPAPGSPCTCKALGDLYGKNLVNCSSNL